MPTLPRLNTKPLTRSDVERLAETYANGLVASYLVNNQVGGSKYDGKAYDAGHTLTRYAAGMLGIPAIVEEAIINHGAHAEPSEVRAYLPAIPEALWEALHPVSMDLLSDVYRSVYLYVEDARDVLDAVASWNALALDEQIERVKIVAGLAVRTLTLRCSKCGKLHHVTAPKRGVELDISCCGWSTVVWLGADGEPRADGYCDPVKADGTPFVRS
jgi:hypothetical protein